MPGRGPPRRPPNGGLCQGIAVAVAVVVRRGDVPRVRRRGVDRRRLLLLPRCDERAKSPRPRHLGARVIVRGRRFVVFSWTRTSIVPSWGMGLRCGRRGEEDLMSKLADDPRIDPRIKVLL